MGLFIYDVHHFLDFLTPPVGVCKMCVLSVLKFGLLFEPPPHFNADVVYGRP